MKHSIQIKMSQWWSNQPLRLKGLVVIAVPVLVLLAALISGYVMSLESRQAQQGIQRTLQIQHDIQEVHTLLAEAATGVRGYLLTGQTNFLEPYRIAETDLPKPLQRLRLQIRDPQQVILLERVAALAAKKSEGLHHLVELGSNTPSSTLIPILVSNKMVLDELRRSIDTMRTREELLLQQREEYAEQVNQRAMIATAIAGIAGALGALLAVLLFSTGIVRRVHRLADNAERLARGASLVPAEPATDELGQLASRLDHASILLATRSAEAEKAYREAEQANHAKTEFLSRTSHELRTPLNAILGFAQLLERDLQEPAARDSVAHILKGGRHLLALINEVLDIARIETGLIDIDLQAVEVDNLLREAVALITPIADQTGIDISIKLDPDIDTANPINPADQPKKIHVLADRKRLLQVMLNLLSNAVKYNEPNGSASLHVLVQGRRARIQVSDTGKGIPAELQERLFTPFDRLGAEHRSSEGTGLGLAVSRQIVRAMGGDIEMTSSPGKGSTFWIDLPVADNIAINPAALTPIPVQPRLLRNCTVLYIEDQSSNLALVEILLSRRRNITLISASSGSGGLELAISQQPDLILLDLHLPDMDGEQVLASVRATPAMEKIPVVILSADALPSTITHMMSAGANAYLTKPLDVSLFFSTLDRLLS
ncbi:ATP-binding protein [Undibacterium sp. RTI2.1]|uniref:ATP-binding protein n=1 Tax=unclassified Undibacterium TaxID=2630295 RepID=UPI002AB35130|nr:MULTISPECIES: ATP-binding protein [unclassified Undibacterium]MDY7540336.1 ATP-binding protein [Undibacterium sp. 5I1]MEB0029944.1 ATP-binding protein [Undibacterium sp. RTI2.1]MEB0117092.1 ATP-binding protein [Undibacterium sp. RTI2.2]MEB0229968.1 ATP-binding protein [Undibacterium sp. 10I3]MEB0259505.1 ATP-binding protein [Undibacterium sp. 5I1]